MKYCLDAIAEIAEINEIAAHSSQQRGLHSFFIRSFYFIFCIAIVFCFNVFETLRPA